MILLEWFKTWNDLLVQKNLNKSLLKLNENKLNTNL